MENYLVGDSMYLFSKQANDKVVCQVCRLQPVHTKVLDTFDAEQLEVSLKKLTAPEQQAPIEPEVISG